MFAENLAEFGFKPSEFGEVATYTQQGGGVPKNIYVHFEANYTAPLSLVQSEESTAIAQLADIPNVKDGDAITILGKNYIIRIAEKDWGGGQGLVMLHLEEV